MLTFTELDHLRAFKRATEAANIQTRKAEAKLHEAKTHEQETQDDLRNYLIDLLGAYSQKLGRTVVEFNLATGAPVFAPEPPQAPSGAQETAPKEST